MTGLISAGDEADRDQRHNWVICAHLNGPAARTWSVKIIGDLCPSSKEAGWTAVTSSYGRYEACRNALPPDLRGWRVIAGGGTGWPLSASRVPWCVLFLSSTVPSA
jgi:hypothetical protein